MASFTTTIEEFSTNGNSTTFAISGTHTASAPRLVIQRRRVANGAKQYYEMDMDIVHGLLDADGKPVEARMAAKCTMKIPTVATSAQIDSLVADYRDFVNSDEFVESVKKQLWLQ